MHEIKIKSQVNDIFLTADRKWLFVATHDNRVFVYPSDSMDREPLTIETGMQNYSIIADSRMSEIVIGCNSGVIFVYDFETKTEKQKMEKHGCIVWTLLLANDD